MALAWNTRLEKPRLTASCILFPFLIRNSPHYDVDNKKLRLINPKESRLDRALASVNRHDAEGTEIEQEGETGGIELDVGLFHQPKVLSLGDSARQLLYVYLVCRF
jgi:hypothetical protein